MKIAFLCGALEEGRDGVGDYTRKLAIKMIENGHQAIIIALHDTFISEVKSGIQQLEHYDVPVLRIPSSMPANDRFAEAKKHLDVFKPDWISLQYVPFSFNKRGIHFGFGKQLLALEQNCSWEIMFHELWVGMQQHAGIKLRVWGWIQKFLIKQLLRDLRPAVVHTQTKLYQYQLGRISITAKYLPLFANIPASKSLALKQERNREKEISLVFFGSIYPGAKAMEFTQEVVEFQKLRNITVSLKFIGRCGPEQLHWFELWKSLGLKTEIIGELPAWRISEELSKADIGLTTTPVYLVEKSGVVAAMWLHKLPVICVSAPWFPRVKINLAYPDGIVEYSKGNIAKCLDLNWEGSVVYTADDVSQLMINDFYKPEKAKVPA